MDSKKWKAIVTGTIKEYLKLSGYVRRPHKGTWKDVAKFLGLAFAVFIVVVTITNCI